MGSLTAAISLEAVDVCQIFNRVFAQDATQLIAGGDEPLYTPATAAQPVAYIVYARGLVQSALHEIAHWLYAGAARRQLVDYGYWYIPDGRNQQEQSRFEQHEVAVQGIEWVLSIAAGVQFRVSADNISNPHASTPFIRGIYDRCGQLMDAHSWPASWRDLIAQLCACSARQESRLKSDPAYVLALIQA